MKRRTFLTGSAATATALASQPARSHYPPPATGQVLGPNDLAANAARVREQFLKDFDPPTSRMSFSRIFWSAPIRASDRAPDDRSRPDQGERSPGRSLGLDQRELEARPQDGVTVFLQGLEKRGPDNRRKSIYMSAVTPDLYRPMYGDKVTHFFDTLLDGKNAGKPLMRPYLEAYWDLYWDLHLGVKGEAIPAQVRQIGESFNTVLAYRDPTQRIVYDHYMAVRSNLGFLKSWIDARIADMIAGKTPNPDKTFVYYWIKNGEEGENFRHKDVVFECFHNFVAFSQWGNSIYNIMLRLGRGTGDPDAQACVPEDDGERLR